MSIEVIDADHLDRLPQLDRPSDAASCYIASIVRRGPSSFLDNANVRMEALLIDEKILPLVISAGIEGNSSVCSAYSHYYEYASDEFARRFGRVPFAMLKAPGSLLAAALRAGSIDRIVFVNNWLLSTNPGHGLSSAQVAAVTSYLTRRYSGSAIVFRSINPLSDGPGFKALRTNHFRFVPSRRVYMVDTASRRYLERSNLRTDLSKLKRTSYSIVDGSSDLTPHARRFAQLYRDLYLDKHSELNPQYRADFFALILEGRFLTHRAFIKDGRVDAFISYLLQDEVITGALIAYDLNSSRKLALYRMGVALLIAEAAQRKVLVNLSAGAGDFKMLRGAMPVQEYDAVYDCHLPIYRRLPWTCLRAVAQLGRMLSPRPRV